MSSTTGAAVARKKSGKPKKGPEGVERKAMAIQVRGSDAWKAWAEELAQFDTRPVAALVDRALRRYAREIGFPKEAPER